MKIALLGTGLLGAALAKRLFNENVDLIVWNRSREKLAPLEEMGIQIADTAQQAITQADAIILMLSDATAIRAVLFNDKNKSLLAGKTIIQMGTIASYESCELEHEFKNVQADYLEAPVLGSIPQAKEGTLIVMVGSSEAQFEQWQPLFSHFSQQIRHVGGIGSAAALKLALNQLIASLTIAFSLSLGVVMKNGVNVDIFMDILRNSALYAPTFDKKLNNMLTHTFENPNFPTKHLLKDINLVLDEADRLDLGTEALAGVKTIVERALTTQLNDLDYSSIFEAVVQNEK